MSALDRFEDWLHGVLEGRLGGLLGASIQPVDMARRLADHMEDHRTIGVGRVYAPNVYRLYLAPRTLATYAAVHGALEHELGTFLGARAAERGLQFVGSVRVGLLADAVLRPEQMRIDSDLVERIGAPGGAPEHTVAIEAPAPRPPIAVSPTLLRFGRREVTLRGSQPVAVGRALDNDVILDDATVSRHHARLTPRGEHWLLEDLDSRLGCYVNGHRVSAGLLRIGDVVRIGDVTMHLEGLPGEEAPP